MGTMLEEEDKYEISNQKQIDWPQGSRRYQQQT
jgi:hypothetical protein